jgi:DNA-binding NarL/FixJ family response regulator
MKRRPLRALVVDDSNSIRRALCELLKSQTDIEVVYEASNGSDALRLAKEHKPDLVLLDIAMPVMNGFAATRLIKQELPNTRILIITQHDIEPFMTEAFAAGASAYVSKDNASKTLIPEVHRIMSDLIEIRDDPENAA